MMKRRSFLASAAALLAVSIPNKAKAWLRGNAASSFWQPGQRPFAASSPGNTPLPSNPILVPVNWPASTGGNYFINEKFPFDIPAPTAPVCTFPTNAGGGYPAQTLSVQTTSGFTQNGDSDAEVVIITGNTALSLDGFFRLTDTSVDVAGHGNVNNIGFADLVTGSGFGTTTPAFLGAGVYATLQSCMMGALLKEEFMATGAFPNNGEINHVVALCADIPLVNGGVSGAQYYPPAINNDGSSSNGLFIEGQLVAIPRSTVMPGGMSTFGQKIFRAFQNYGAIICDVGGATQFYLGYSYNNPAASWQSADITALFGDIVYLITSLQKVGYPLDGLFQQMAVFDTCAPQLQQMFFDLPTPRPLMHVTRDSGGSPLDIGKTAAPQSLLDTSAIATYGAGTTVRCATYYGQFGHDFLSAGSAAPIIYASGALKTMNSQPALAFDGSTNYLKNTGSSASYPNGSMYLAAVIQIPDYAANYGIFGGATAGGLELRVDQTTGLVRLLKNGGATIAVTPYQIPINAPVLVSTFYNSDGSFSIWLNGVKMVQGTGTLVSMTAGDIQVGAGGPAGTELFKGLIGGWLICSNAGINAWPRPQFGMESYFKNFWGPLGTIVVNTTHLDPAHSGSGMTLSNGNLTVSDVGGGSSRNAFGTVAKSTGLLYDEITVNASALNAIIGIANNSVSVNSAFPGQDLNGIGWINDGRIFINGAVVTTIASWTTGSIVARAVDLTHGKIWFGIISGSTITWNNDVLANQNPATNTGGIPLSTLNAGPYYPVLSSFSFGTQYTENFGASAYSNITLVPSGFGNWQ
jgi:hypothetical protein